MRFIPSFLIISLSSLLLLSCKKTEVPTTKKTTEIASKTNSVAAAVKPEKASFNIDRTEWGMTYGAEGKVAKEINLTLDLKASN